MSDLNYTVQAPEGLIDQLALKKRLQMLAHFQEAFPYTSFDKVLDVGVTADTKALASNYFEAYFPDKNRIIALSNQDAVFLETLYPGLTFKRGDAKQLPFADNSIDVVFSSAVIEHIGNVAEQRQMIAECLRVAKRGIFITTPNRWHPIEAHTLLPFIHWLPKKWHRVLLKCLGLTFYADEQNLNLLDAKTLHRIACSLNHTATIRRIKTGGLTSNLILIIKKSCSKFG